MSLFRRNYIPCIGLLYFGHLYPTSLANLVFEVGTRHSHQILLEACTFNYGPREVRNLSKGPSKMAQTKTDESETVVSQTI